MSVDQHVFSFCLANTFKTMGTTLCAETLSSQKKMSKVFEELEMDERLYYNKYATSVATELFGYLGNIDLFETNEKEDDGYDLRLSVDGGETYSYVSLSHKDVAINDIIPVNLGSVLKFKKKSDDLEEFKEKYAALNKKMYKEVKSFDKFSEVPDESKMDDLFEPTCKFIKKVIEENQDRAKFLYKHLFDEEEKIVIKLLKSRFAIYDFGIKTIKHINSCEVEIDEDDKNKLLLEFNNGAQFCLVLGTNASEIKEHISLKYKTKYKNINDTYFVGKGTISI